jgi:transposase
MKRKRRTFSSKQKAKIALAALQERQPASEIARVHEVHPNQVSQWKRQALEILQTGFEDKRKSARTEQDQQALIEHLYQRIGQLQVELDWLKKKSEQL